MPKKLVYLATPYAHDSRHVMRLRFEEAVHAAGLLITEHDLLVFSPIAHCHLIAERFDTARGWPLWGPFDLRMIDACDELLVLQIDGWMKSKGIAAEIDYCRSKGKAVRYARYNGDKLEIHDAP